MGPKIRTLDEDVADWGSMSHLDLSGNPLECDCHLAWLNELLQESPGLPRPQCRAPEAVERRELGALSDEELACSSGNGGGGSDRGASNAAVISVAVICSVLTVGLLGYGCYYFKRHPTARDSPHSAERVKHG